MNRQLMPVFKTIMVNNMTPKQRENQARFKKVIAEAKKLRAKNKTLTQAQAVKQAWAIMYSKGGKIGTNLNELKKSKLGKAGSVFSSLKNKAVSAKKNIAYSIIDKTTKSANKKEKATLNKAKKLIQNTYLGATKVKAKKPKRTSEMHTDTKSHNVNIRVVSGVVNIMDLKRDLDKTILLLESAKMASIDKNNTNYLINKPLVFKNITEKKWFIKHYNKQVKILKNLYKNTIKEKTLKSS